MPRANHHFLPGHVWHITHRCHQKEISTEVLQPKVYCPRKPACRVLARAQALPVKADLVEFKPKGH
jgi:hypothetical protein